MILLNMHQRPNLDSTHTKYCTVSWSVLHHVTVQCTVALCSFSCICSHPIAFKLHSLDPYLIGLQLSTVIYSAVQYAV